MSKLLLLASLYCISTINGAPCIPADTCFQSVNNVIGGATILKSTKYTCSGGKVTRHLYTGCSDCSCSAQTSVRNDLSDLDMIDSGSSTGALDADIVQGTDCPVLTSSSASCTEYMYVRKYGASGYSVNGEDLPYQDIGTDCVNKGVQWDGFLLPVGCADLSSFGATARQEFTCSSSAHTFQYDYYPTTCANGGGSIYTAQSDSYTTDSCSTFSERTHCGGNSAGSQTICSTGGVLVEYDYWIDLMCCGDCTSNIDGIIRSGSSNNPGTTSGGGNPSTPEPTEPDTPEPTPATPGPTTKNPTGPGGTGRPTTPAPTAIPGGNVNNPGSDANQLKCIVSIFIMVIGLLY